MGLPAGLRLNGPERVILFGLYEAPLQPRSAMIAQVRQYLTSVEAEAEHREFVDTDQAARLANAIIAMIEGLTDHSPDEHRRLVQAAAAYFALTDDVSDDVGSPIGFDDDERVTRAVAAYVGRPELLP
jgi:uncharacterized membrane protein YkvA (DUF1232 family)